MANKYIIHGATYNGDGTSSAEATSNGGVGAWNTLAYFEGTTPAYGTLAAGDTVNIRSKTSAGADITRTMAAGVSLGSTNATSAAPITWIIDNGAVWSGVDGTITYTQASTYTLTFLVNNNFLVMTVGALININTAASPANGTQAIVAGVVNGAKFDTIAKTGANSAASLAVSGVLENPIIKCGRLSSTVATNGVIGGMPTANSAPKIINPDIELTYPTPAGQVIVGTQGSYSSNVTVIGGRVYGVGVTSAQTLARLGSSSGSSIDIVGMDIPKELIPCADITTFHRVSITAADASLGGHLEELWGYATSRSDNNPPTLSARLPDSSSTPFSYRVYPRNTSSSVPAVLPSMKLFTDTTAAKVVTCEFLVADSLSPDANNIWMSVSYTDSTGANKNISTRFDSSAFSSSSAAWTGRSGSTVPWGMVTLNPYKLALTTPTSIKQDTPITVTFFTTLNAAGNTSNILFLDPDFALSSP